MHIHVYATAGVQGRVLPNKGTACKWPRMTAYNSNSNNSSKNNDMCCNRVMISGQEGSVDNRCMLVSVAWCRLSSPRSHTPFKRCSIPLE